MNPNETMSRERPGNLTFFSASRTCSCVGIDSLLWKPSLIRLADDRNGFVGGADDLDHVEVGRTDQSALDHGPAHPVDQSGPHCTDEDERMLFHVLDLQKLPDHEELQRCADAAREDDECRR